jgi:hypothetical protein
MREMIDAGVDRMKTSLAKVLLIVVGGGSILVRDVAGVSELVKPDHSEAANAVGQQLPKTRAKSTGSSRLADRNISLERAPWRSRKRRPQSGRLPPEPILPPSRSSTSRMSHSPISPATPPGSGSGPGGIYVDPGNSSMLVGDCGQGSRKVSRRL